MRLIIFLLFEILAAFVAAVPVVVSSRLSDASAQAFSSNLNNTRLVEFRILASSKDEPSLQPRDEAVVDTPELKDENVTASNEPHDRNTRNRLRDLLSIIPRASKSPSKGSGGGGGGGKSPTQRPAPARQPSSRTPAPARQASSRTPSGSGSGSGSRAPTTRPPTKGQVSTKSQPQTQTQPQSKSMNMKNPTKAELDAADKKFNRKGLPENQRKYLDNLDKQKANDCGQGCKNNLNSFRSDLSKQQKEQLKNPPAPGPSRADRNKFNSDKDDKDHDFNHLRMLRESIGPNGEAQLSSWHSVEHKNSVNSKASKASKDSQASKNSQASKGGG